MRTYKIKKSMNSLGAIITILLFLIVVITLILNSILNSVIISKYFTKIEKQESILKTEQSIKILQSQIKGLETTVQDYGIWDDTYDKMQEKIIDETWFEENFTTWLPEKFGADLVVLVNRNKKIIAQTGLNNINGILDDNRILKSLSEDKFNEKIIFSGFKKYNGDIYMISVSPILKSNFEGNSQGIVIMGKKISSTLLKKIKSDFGVDIFITYDNKLVSNDDVSEDINKNIAIVNKNKNNPVYKLDNSKMIGSSPIKDISGNNIGYINVIQSRDTFVLTEKLVQRNGFFVMLLSTIIIIILEFRFKKNIVKPIKNLESQIKSMENNTLLIHANVNGPNEIVNLAEGFNNMVDNIYEHKKQNEDLKLYVNTDYLTSMYNHKYYFECVESNIAEGQKQIAVMFCDIDKFKSANDTYGHEVGDFLLKQTAKIIKAEVKDTGIVFRYGGEEFVFIMCDYTSEEALIKAEKIRKSIAKSQELQKYADYFPITISIGIASYPIHAIDAVELINKSDTAMYYSKQSGRNQCNIYNENMNVFLKDSNEDINKELLMDSVLAIAEAVDAKHKYTGEHSKMVSKYSMLLAEKLDLTEIEKNKLRIGALLHDCGKIGVPDNIINNTGKLSDEEFTIIKRHTLLGYNIIKHMTNDEEIINCVRSHHERWDGTGYPDGLIGMSINLFARIVCIADVYHAMTSDRPYRKALTKEKSIEEFIRAKGTQFDPKLVEICVEIIKHAI